MSLSTESNTDLAFDTSVFKTYAAKYGDIADDLREMASDLNSCLSELASSGWTTGAGQQFQKLADNNWETSIKKYANLFDTLETVVKYAATQYENLASNHIEKTKIK